MVDVVFVWEECVVVGGFLVFGDGIIEEYYMWLFCLCYW